MKVLCDTVWNVDYDANEYRVIYKYKTVCNGNKEPSTGLWVIILNPTINSKLSMDHVQLKPKTEVASNAYTIPSKHSLINYVHRYLFFPPFQKYTPQIRSQQSISNLARSNICGSQKISPQRSISNGKMPHETATARYTIHQSKFQGWFRPNQVQAIY